MYRRDPWFRHWKKACTALVFGALLLRLATAPAVLAPLRQLVGGLRTDPAFASLMLYLEFGQAVDCPDLSPQQAGTVTVSAPAAAPSKPPTLQQTAAAVQALALAGTDAVQIAGNCTYPVDQAALLAQPLRADFSGSGPKILIVHTHASEAYTPDDTNRYDDAGGFHTDDAACNVIRVGAEMAQVFEEHGIEVIHDTTLNDAAGYGDAYDRMGARIADYLARYPSIQMVLDVHRDAFEAADGTPAGAVVDVDGETSAQLMLVMGTDQGGLYHPDWQENLSCALKVQTLLDRQYPGICRDLALRTARYNQQQTPCSMLVEVGATGNTLPQALTAARHFADAVSTLIQTSTVSLTNLSG